MEGCTLSGKLFSYGDMNFTNCQFTQTNSDYHMWTYAGNVTYTNCTFTNEKTGKFINVYNESGATKYTITATNCKFINKEGNAANKAAVNVKATSDSNLLAYDVIINNCATEGAFPEASSTDALVVLNSVVQVDDRTADGVDNIKVWKDGVQIYPYIEPAVVSAPVVFHDSGEYETGLSVPMYAQAGAKIYYTTDGSEPTTASTEYTGALTIKKATTVKAIAVLDGVASAVVTREYTIKAAADEIEAIDGYYSIKNNGNEKYINVAGRKTVTFVADGDEADKAGTVLKVKINTKGQVEELRSQGVDLPGYADRAMNYVPKFVKLIVDKLHAEGSGEILGEHGLDAIMQKFNDSFDYHLYVEKADAGYRIYGKTPSMKPVVDFYAENKDNVDYKLPQLEAFINSAIQKVLQKTGGRGASILTEFKLHDIWQKMGETLTEPVKDDAASIAKFYEEVLASEANVWNFAYQTAMTYWTNVKSHPRYEELKGKLGEYANYIEKVENIQPDFKYYIVGKENGVDFISEGNIDIQNNAARTIWTMNERNDYKVTFTKENSLNIGRELYTTLYVDFAYTLPETVKAYKVTAIDEKTGLATKEEITGVIPAQTPVLLQMIVDPKTVTDADLTQTLSLSTEAGSAVAGNLLQGPEWLINNYSITAKQVVDLFGYVHDFLKLADVEALYDSYVKEYEYLMMRNAGTVNNKYFFGLSGDDIADADVNVCQLAKQGNTRKRLAFYHNLEKVDANKAFIPSEKVEPVYLSLIGDVNRDGYVNITDVTCQIDIVLGKDKPEDNYDYDAADLDGNDEIRIDDVTDLIDVVLGKKTIE
ncbi:MAG: chitobiase/beta-hexosaminidase C-terminal domain-containing protein [Prevotella sp.]|nr:chitobiase/beta-hexosaminidase C-terminal domain-containing protein [Prevotella sp.]